MERENKFHFLTCINVIYKTEFLVYLLSKHCALCICFSSTRSAFPIGSPKNQSERPNGCYADFSPFCKVFIVVCWLHYNISLLQNWKLFMQVGWTRKTIIQAFPFRGRCWSARSSSIISSSNCACCFTNRGLFY